MFSKKILKFRRLATLATVPMLSFSLALSEDSNSEKALDKAVIEKIDDEEYWQEKGENCSFCATFLSSPCNIPFRKWSNCIEQAKGLDLEYVVACREYSDDLFTCGRINKEWFDGYMETNTSKDEKDDSDFENNETEERNDPDEKQ